MTLSDTPRPGIAGPRGAQMFIRPIGEALDEMGEALCLFDADDNCVYWNRTFLIFFPEHAGHVHEGEPYRENLPLVSQRLEQVLLNRIIAEFLRRWWTTEQGRNRSHFKHVQIQYS